MELVVWVLAGAVLTLSLCSCGSKKYSELETWPQGGGGNTKNLSEQECVLGGWAGMGAVGGGVRQRLTGSWRCLQSFAFISLLRENGGQGGEGRQQINDSVNLGQTWQ